MKTEINEIEINGVKYVPKDSVFSTAESLNGMPYVVCRFYSAGVFAGYLEKKTFEKGETPSVILRKARRLWRWYGAQECTELARTGINNSTDNKICGAIEKIEVFNCIEISYATEAAQKTIEGAPVWKA